MCCALLTGAFEMDDPFSLFSVLGGAVRHRPDRLRSRGWQL